jgi:hypothetical protein
MQAEMLRRPDQKGLMASGVPQLCDLAAAGLVQMFDAEKQLFCDIYARTESGMARQGISHRYTLMTLLGLHRYETSGRKSPIAIEPVLDNLLRDRGWVTNAGDLGLLLWTCAELAPDRVPQVYRDVKAPEALARFSDGQQGCTMEVSWYLTGLANCRRIGYSDLPGLMGQVEASRKILESNCGPSGVYGHLARSKSLKAQLRRKIGSFADQVYPTIALSHLSMALQDNKAREMALRTARTICELQGGLGEWCWHYNSLTGRVVNRYPVYSVHQHAMGPMMLFAAGEATGNDFSEAIYRGLAWIGGQNELRFDFVDTALNLIWRCLYLERADAYLDTALRALKMRRGGAGGRPRIRYECRPYELGWLLYAFAGK